MNEAQWDEEFYAVVNQAFDTLVDRLAWLRDKHAADNGVVDESIYTDVEFARLLGKKWLEFTLTEENNDV